MDTNYNPFSLESKTILVTGASSGIGQKTAIECSKMGARMVITGRNAERLQDTYSQLEGEGHIQKLAELTVQEDIEKLIDGLPVLDGLVLCAGSGATKPFQFCTRDQFDKVFNINYFAPVELLRLLVKKKMLAKPSSVVFVSSIGGVWSFNPGNGVYGASKAALNSTMKFCALELAPKKIRVNSVNPGMVHTKLINPSTISEEQQIANMGTYPLKRYGEPEEVAYGIIYLLSDASSWITGHSLVIDGGKTI
jgi:NAD(P)-dependent dehydrogenase (short-subunit alcohol dehydrogenase family)